MGNGEACQFQGRQVCLGYIRTIRDLRKKPRIVLNGKVSWVKLMQPESPFEGCLMGGVVRVQLGRRLAATKVPL